jgi:hypothetical protein
MALTSLLSVPCLLAAVVCTPPSYAQSTSWDVTVVANEDGSPLGGVWVCVAAGADNDNDGMVDAAAGFTSPEGKVSLALPANGQRVYFLNVVAQGRGAFLRKSMLLPSGEGKVVKSEVRLEQRPTANIFWGQLSATRPGGGQIEVLDRDFLPKAVTAPDGRFALSLDRQSLLDLIITGPRLRGTQWWTIDPLVLGSYESPNQIPAHSWLPAQLKVVLAGGGSLGPDVQAFIARVTDSGPVGSWQMCDPDSGGGFSAQVEATEDYHVMVVDGARWGIADANDIQDGQLCEVALREPAPEALTIDVRSSAGGSAIAFGTVHLRIETATAEGISGPDYHLLSQPVPSTGLVTFSGIPPGQYQARWSSGGRGGVLHNIPFDGDLPLTAQLVTNIRQNHGLSAGGYTGVASVVGAVMVSGGSLDTAEVSLVDPASHEVLFTTTTTAQANGAFEFSDVPAGVYLVTALGWEEGGEVLFQLDGPVPIAVDGPSVDAGAPILYGGRCALVVVFKADQEWNIVGPAPLATVTVRSAANVLLQVETDSMGRALLYGLPEATLTISVDKPGYESSVAQTVDSGEWLEPPPLAFMVR